MPCDDRQLTDAQRAAAFDQQRTGVQRAIRPFSGEATVENLVDYLNRELVPTVKQSRDKLNEVFLQVKDNAPSGNPLGYYFSTETGNADPTAGRIRLDNATQDTATTIRVSQSNGRLVDTAPWLDVMAGSATAPLGVVTLTDAINPGRFIRFDLDSMTDQGAYWDLSVTPVESSHDNPFVNDGAVVISFIPGVSSAGSTVGVGSLTPVADDTVLANVSGALAAPSAVALANFGGTGIDYNATTHAFDAAGVPLTSLDDVTGPTLLGLETGTGAPEELTGAEAGHLIKKSSVINPTISANQDDWSPTGLADADIINVSIGANVLTLTGIDSSVFEELPGTQLVLRVIGTGSLTLTPGSGSSLAANRIATTGSFPVALENGQSISLLYCSLAGVPGWLMLPHSPMLTGDALGNRLRKTDTISATIAATTHNWSPTGLVDAHVILLTLTGNQTLTGIDSSVFTANGQTSVGREILLVNVDTTDTLTISPGSGSSLAGNRFGNHGPSITHTIGPGQSCVLYKEAPESLGVWKVRMHVGAAPARSVLGSAVNTTNSTAQWHQSSAGRQAFMSNSANTALAWRAMEYADLPAVSDDSMVVNISGSSSTLSERALSSMVGDGLDYNATSHVWEVDVTDIVDNVTITEVATNNIQRAALTGFAAASAGSNATTSAEPIVTYSASSNMSAERVTTSSTSITVSTSVASQIEFQRAALTGDVTASANSNATTIANDAVTNAKAANMAANTLKANPTASTADPQDLAISANSLPARVGSNLVSHPFSTLAGAGLSYSAGVIDAFADASKHGLIDADGIGFRKSRRRHFWYEDFDVFPSDAAIDIDVEGQAIEFGQTQWLLEGIGGAAITADIDAVSVASAGANHPGVVRITTDATSGEGARMYRAGHLLDPSFGTIQANKIYSFEAVVRVPTTTANVFFAIGMADDLGSSGINNAIEFYASAGGSVHAYCEEATTATDTDTGFTPVADEWNVYGFIQETIGTIDFYIDDVLEATISTNVPDTEQGAIGIAIATQTAGARSIDIDYVAFESVDLGTRTS